MDQQIPLGDLETALCAVPDRAAAVARQTFSDTSKCEWCGGAGQLRLVDAWEIRRRSAVRASPLNVPTLAAVPCARCRPVEFNAFLNGLIDGWGEPFADGPVRSIHFFMHRWFGPSQVLSPRLTLTPKELWYEFRQSKVGQTVMRLPVPILIALAAWLGFATWYS